MRCLEQPENRARKQTTNEVTTMAENGEKLYKTKYQGVIDADGHVLEAADLWEKYCEAKYKPCAVRLGLDDKGYQRLEVNGKPSKFIHNGVLGILGAMGMLSREKWQWDFNRKWGEVAAYGAVDAKDRIKRLDAENLAGAIIYPTIGLGWECECEDAELAQAHDPRIQPLDRRVVLGQRRPADPGRAPVIARSAGRGQRNGARGQGRMQGRLGRVRSLMTANPMGIPTTTRCSPRRRNSTFRWIHPTVSPLWAQSGLYSREYMGGKLFFDNVIGTDAARQAMTSFIQYGTFDKFPRLKIVMLEVGCRMGQLPARSLGRRVQ